MEKLKVKSNPEVKKVFRKYPKEAREKLQYLRNLVLETAEEIEGVKEVEETLKWGQPSYLTKLGSTLRMDWSEETPDQYAMYFQCTSRLVPTFREVFGHVLTLERNRAILFQMDEALPEGELKKCIATALTYHKAKHKPMLGL